MCFKRCIIWDLLVIIEWIYSCLNKLEYNKDLYIMMWIYFLRMYGYDFSNFFFFLGLRDEWEEF